MKIFLIELSKSINSNNVTKSNTNDENYNFDNEAYRGQCF